MGLNMKGLPKAMLLNPNEPNVFKSKIALLFQYGLFQYEKSSSNTFHLDPPNVFILKYLSCMGTFAAL